MKPLLQHPLPEYRAIGLRAITAFGDSQTLEQSVSFLDDPSPLVALVATRGLIQSGNRDLKLCILDHLGRITKFSAQLSASLLKEMGPDMIPQFRTIAKDESAPRDLRKTVIETLISLTDNGFCDIIVSDILSRKEEDPEILRACLDFLSKLGAPKHAAAVRPFLDHKDFFGRVYACIAIGELGSRSDIPKLRQLFSEQNSWVSFRAAEALHQLGDIQFLQEQAETDEQSGQRARQVLES